MDRLAFRQEKGAGRVRRSMRILSGMDLFAVGVVCLLLCFGSGCALKEAGRPVGVPAGQDAFRNLEDNPRTRGKVEEGPIVGSRLAAAKQGAEPAEAAATDDGDQEETKSLVIQPGRKRAESEQPSEPGTSREEDEKAGARKDSAGEALNPSNDEGAENRAPVAEEQDGTGGEGDELVLNFDNADLAEVIKTIADLLGINYILDKGVGGVVTINTSGSIKKDELFPVFYQILETNGYTAVKKGSLYHIIPIQEASRMPIASSLRAEPMDVEPGGQMVIQLIELDSIAAQELIKILQPFVSANGTIVALENANILMVVDQAANLEKLLRMVEAFDKDIFETTRYRFYPLEYGDAEELSSTLEQMFKSYGTAIQAKINLIAITRLNALLVISPSQRVFKEIDEFVKEFDIPSKSTESGIYVYPVKNGRAGEITDILEQVFTGKPETERKRERDEVYRNPLAREAKTERTYEEREQEGKADTGAPSQPSPRASDVSIGSGSLHGEVKITADEVRNALIIEATAADYRIIKNLLEEIDILPRQVLIEVTIAEVTLNKRSELGVEWTYLKGEESLGSSLLSASIDSSGLRYTIGKTDRWTATMRALAEDNRVNILSSPSIVASNSEEAKIDISSEVPVASSQYEYTSGDTPLVSTNIEYRDTGVMLTVTPHINKNGIVTMEIAQEVSEQAESVQVGNLSYPSFFKRNAETILTVKSGQTIAIGGLIRENKSDGSAGAPWFINIPILKYFFGRTSESLEKNELIILISPHVISSLDDVDAVTEEFKDKLGSIYKDRNEQD